MNGTTEPTKTRLRLYSLVALHFCPCHQRLLIHSLNRTVGTRLLEGNRVSRIHVFHGTNGTITYVHLDSVNPQLCHPIGIEIGKHAAAHGEQITVFTTISASVDPLVEDQRNLFGTGIHLGDLEIP